MDSNFKFNEPGNPDQVGYPGEQLERILELQAELEQLLFENKIMKNIYKDMQK